MGRIYLSPPHVGVAERGRLLEAFDSNWIAPLGPEVDAFEAEFASIAGRSHAVALSSGTAALHLALILLGFMEAQRNSMYVMHALCLCLLVGRICHAIALSREGSSGPLRFIGMMLTGTVLIIAAIALIYDFFLVLPTI
mgnify:CR=1 FL=1